MQKRSFLKSPFGIAAVVCFVIAFVSPFIFVDSQVSKKETSTAKNVSTKTEVTVTITPSKGEEDTQVVQGQTSVANPSATPTPLRQGSEGQASATVSNTTATVATATPVLPTSAPAKQTLQVSLSINGSSVGLVTVDQGANQCDVLTNAKDQGKISQLTMRYDNSLGTNGVYQINGIGKDNSVWWVYKVNGTSPGQGCSFLKANSGDNVEWEYKG